MAKAPKKQGPTAEERELERVSVAQWNDYVARFRPAEAELIRRSQLTEGERASVRGQAGADTAAAFKDLASTTVRSGLKTGARVSSGRTKFGLAGDALAEGRTKGLAQTAAESGAEVDRDETQLGIAATGRNIATEATSDLARGARRSTQLALAASEARFQRSTDVVNALSAVAGAATRKFGDPFGDKKKKRSFDQVELEEDVIQPTSFSLPPVRRHA